MSIGVSSSRQLNKDFSGNNDKPPSGCIIDLHGGFYFFKK